jgi:hypothetical protein
MGKLRDKKGILKIVLTLAIAILCLLPSSAIIAEKNNVGSENSEIISYNYANENELIITFTLKDLIQDQVTYEEEQFTVFNIPDTGFIGTLGKPQLPLITKMIAVPVEGVAINVINSKICESKQIGKIYPSQSPQTDDGKYGKNDFIIDESFYQQDIQYPGILSNIVYEGKIRDITFVKIEFYPIQYNPKKEIATIYEEITIKLTWGSGESVSVESDFSHSSFSNLYKNTFINWEGFLDNTQILEQSLGPRGGGRDSGCDYIIITHPDFYNNVVEFANWKNAQGYMVCLVDTTDAGTTSNEIKQYIQNAYDTWNPRPSYLLIVGDAEFVPVSLTSPATDLYYATVDGSDYFPDIFYGRIPVDTSQEAEIIFDKIIKYEQNPPTLSSFYHNMAVAAYFQDDEHDGYETRRFVRTSEEVRDYLLSQSYDVERIYVTESNIDPTHYNNGYYGNGEPLPAELLRPTFAWDGDYNDIIDAIENGVFILNHRDHGFEDGWGDPYFDSGHVEGLTNGDLLPTVYSLNCLTGRFDGYECFAEKFLRKEGGGAVAVFAATRVSYSGYNDWLCRGMYDAQWPNFDTEIGTNNPMYTLGEIMNYGKVYMTQTWGDPWGYEDYTFELFHVFGDPTMETWTAVPQTLNVTYELYPHQLVVNVKKGSNPLKDALVCVCQENGFYARELTDNSGQVTFELTNTTQEVVTLTVTAHNYRYNQQTFYLNKAPEPPTKPSGEERPEIDITYDYETSTTDFEGEDVFYWFDWGDNTTSGWLGPYASGANVIASHSWSARGPCIVKVKAKDINDQESQWSEELNIMVSNAIPEITKLTGKNKNLKPHESYLYTATAFDADDDQIWIQIYFSDGGGTGWRGPYASGESYSIKHVWMETNTQYTVKAKTKDIFGEESEWVVLDVNTPRSRPILFNLLEIIQNRYPIIAQILQRILT